MFADSNNAFDGLMTGKINPAKGVPLVRSSTMPRDVEKHILFAASWYLNFKIWLNNKVCFTGIIDCVSTIQSIVNCICYGLRLNEIPFDIGAFFRVSICFFTAIQEYHNLLVESNLNTL